MSRCIKIKRSELVELLRSVSHACPVSFICLTDARAKKTGNEIGNIFKLTRLNAFTGAIYENAVNRQLVREDKVPLFEAKPRKWGKRVSHALVEHVKDGILKHYLPCHVTRAGSPLYLVEQAVDHVRRKRRRLKGIAKELIAELLPEKRSSAEAQGVEKEIVYRDVALESITSISIGGKVYRVED